LVIDVLDYNLVPNFVYIAKYLFNNLPIVDLAGILGLGVGVLGVGCWGVGVLGF
jgi:hypothetical protein